jgi:two-component system sensor histidine kinase ChvG
MARLRFPWPQRLRDRAFLAALVVVALPFLVLVSMNRWEIHRADAAEANALETLARARDLATGGDYVALPGQRLRVLGNDGSVLADVDRSLEPTLLLGVGDFFYGPVAPGLGIVEATWGPLLARPESTRGGAQPRSATRLEPSGNLVVTSAAQWREGDVPRLVHVQAYSRRIGLPAAIESRQGVKVLSLALALAVAAGWLLARRLGRPLQELRQQVLMRATDAVPGARIELGRRDEVGDVADAFNTLLDALAARTRANEAFLTDLAHELKNPVAAVRASAEVLGDGALTAERAQKVIGVLRQSSTQLDALVTQFLELARAEAGLPTDARESLDVAALLRGLHEALSHDPRFPGITWRTRGLDTPCRLSGVAVSVERAFRNLLLNALSFAGTGGWVEVELAAEPGQCRVWIRDSGPGIAPDQLPHLFERFYTTRRERAGTGLGLALTRAIVDAHRGHLSVSSPQGAGAVFEVQLPL